jgi:putative transposase
MARGNRKQPIFADDRDRRRFLRLLATAAERFGADCYAYCLMGNHYHLVLRTPHANLPEVMKHINGLYTRYENWRHRTTGHVFEGRYQALLIDDTVYLRTAIAYVLRNPVAAGLVEDPELWPWSSYRATMGKITAPRFLNLTWLPAIFSARSLAGSRELLAQDVKDERLDEDGELGRSPVEGPQKFKRQVRQVIGATLHRANLPRAYRALGRPSLPVLFESIDRANRKAAIRRAHVVHGYRMVEIANFLQLHPTTISRIVNQSGSYRQA